MSKTQDPFEVKNFNLKVWNQKKLLTFKCALTWAIVPLATPVRKFPVRCASVPPGLVPRAVGAAF